MLQSFKGRELTEGQEVKVYFNLHTHLFSVKDKKTGLVVAHGDNIILGEGVTFKVSEAGRQRVLKEQKKNVHAYVIGTFKGTQAEANVEGMQQAYYNPYKMDSFEVGGAKATQYAEAVLSSKKVFVQ